VTLSSGRSNLLNAVKVALASAAGVSAVWLAREPPVNQGLQLERYEPAGARSQAERPPKALRLDLGLAATRSVLASGFGPDETQDGRSVVSTTSERAVLTPTLAPGRGSTALTLLARATGTAPVSLQVIVNGTATGTLQIAGSWCLRRVSLPPDVLAAGPNEIELRARDPDARVVLDRIWIDPASARAELSASQRQFELEPLSGDYSLGLVGTGETAAAPRAVFLNRSAIGELQPGTGSAARFARVRASQLRAGTNVVEPGPTSSIAKVLLAPLETGLLLDVGTPAVSPYLTHGFSVNEDCEPGDCVWSTGTESTVAVWLRPLSVRYRLAVRGHALAPLAPLQMAIAVNGRALDSVPIGAEFETINLDLPAGLFDDGANTLTLRYAATKQPSAFVPASRDTRELAVRLDWIDVEPNADP
jgi:hypothetical protein